MTIPIQTINLGSYPNDGTGDDLRTAFTKVNTNFQTLFSEGAIVNGANLGTGVGVFSSKNSTNLNLEFKTLTSDASVIITQDNNTVHLAAITKLQNDSIPTLSSNLNLNSHYTYGGDTQTTVYGLDVPVLTNILSTVLSSNQLSLDLGTLQQPTGYQHYTKGYPIDFNGTGIINGFNNPLANDYDFGSFASNNVLNVGTSKLTLNSNLTTNGYSITLNAISNTSVTLPSSGVLATINLGLNQFSGTTSNQLRGVITDNTGTGNLVFAFSPILTGTVTTANISAGGYVYVSGNFAVNGTKFEVDAATGNTIIAGNLSVGGTITAPTRPSNYVTIAQLPGPQHISAGSDTDIQMFATADANHWWNNTNYQFLPNIPGWYNISYTVLWGLGAVGSNQFNVQIHKNTNSISINQNHVNLSDNFTMSASVPIYLNGTTDYVKLTAYTSSSSGQTLQAVNGTIFSAFLISK
jgi:hypothetical protein